jgi:thioredoxin reductase (NADPH)
LTGAGSLQATEPEPLTETPDSHGAYPRLSEEQIQRLAAHGVRRPTQAGEVLFHDGDEHYDFYVVLEGMVAIVQGFGTADEELIAVHGPRRFLGELSLLTGQAAFYTAVVREPGEVLVVPVAHLRELVTLDPPLGDLILRAFLIRRELLIGLGAGLRIVGSRFSPDTLRLREFAIRNRLPHRWIDLEEDAAADGLLRELGIKPEETPVVVWGREVMRNPSNADLARKIGMPAPRRSQAVRDLIVVGAGPAGLAAAVYGASEGLETVTLDAIATGGQAGTSSRIENYLGFPAGISGAELAERATIQAKKFGARLSVPAEATALERRDGHYLVSIADGPSVAARTVVIATGARYRRLPVPGLERFEGTSVFYAATLMEAQMCREDPVVIVGGGNSAGQAAVFLARYAAHVRLLIRDDELARTMSRYLADRIERTPGIEVMRHTEVREVIGDTTLEAVVAEDNRTGERHTLPARALFVFIGAEPHTQWLRDQVALDDHGFVLTGLEAQRAAAERGEERERPPLLLETSLPGVLAVGDVRHGSIKRVASAVGEGAMAVRLVHEHLETHPDAVPAAAAQT